MSKATRIPDEVWESHKETIRDLYQREELKDVIRIMKESYQFQATDKQYIRRLGKWKIKKYSTSEQWRRAGQLVSMRQLDGKESELRMNRRPVSKRKFRKELARRAGPTLQPIQIAAPRAAIPDGFEVYTPPAMIAEASHCIRIPWFEFENLIEAKRLCTFTLYLYAKTSSYPGQVIDLEHGWPSAIPDFEAHIQSTTYDFSHNIASSDFLETDPLAWNLGDPSSARGDETLQSAYTFNREACSVLAHLLNNEVDPDSDKYISEISSSLKGILTEKNQGDLMNNVSGLLKSSPWDVASQLLRYSIYLSSNNLISDRRMDKLLAWIIDHKLLNAIKILISMKTPTTDTFAAYLLVSAARLQDLDTVRDLIALEIDVNVPVGRLYHKTALYEATKNKNIRLVNILIRAGANPTVSDSWFPSPIEGAILKNHKDILIILLDAYKDINSVNYRPSHDELHQAIRQDDPELIRILLTSGVLIDENGDDGGALQYAAALDKLEIVQILLTEGVDANAKKAKDKHGYYDLYPIQHAARNSNIDMVQTLLDFGAGVNKCHSLGHCDIDFDEHDCKSAYDERCACFTALQFAVDKRSTAMATVLLQAGAEVNNLKCGGTPLQIAVGENDRDMVDLLLSRGADVNDPAWKCSGRTALQSAVENRHYDLIGLLIDKRAHINAPAATHCGRTVIQAAVKSGDITLMKKFVALGADINAPPSTVGGRTCLQLAAAMGNVEMVQQLLDFGADINAPIAPYLDNGQTPLQEALEGDYMEVFRLLLDAHTNAGTVLSVLPVITSLGDLEIVRKYLEQTLYRRDDLSLCLLAATKSKSPEIMRYILEKGADIDYHTTSCPAAIHEAVASNDIDIIRILIDSKADLNLACQTDFPAYGNCVMRPLKIAIYNENLEIVQLLLFNGASTDYATDWDNYEYTALGAALSAICLSGNLKYGIVQALLAAGADVNRQVSELGTPLNIVIENGEPELLSLLLKWGANVNRIDTEGSIALQAAAKMNDLGVMKALLHAGAAASINSPASNVHRYGRTALQSAADRGNKTAVTLLLQYGADCNAAAAQNGGVTALQAAAIKGSLPVTVQLLEAGAEINALAARDNGRTALEGAAEHGNLQIVLLLLENDADRDGLEARCNRAAKYAENRYPIIAKFLREYKAI